MTQSTEQERAEFECTIGVDYDLTPSTMRQGQYAVPVAQAAWYGWQAARRATVVPQGYRLQPLSEYDAMCAAIAAAPQPPETAPVQMPEPWGVAVGDRIWVGKAPAHVPKIAEHESLPLQKLYTEHQVRQLLAAHGIK